MVDSNTPTTPYAPISFVISEWMISPEGLNLSNTELLVYAMIHSASTMSNTSLAMTLPNVADVLRMSVSTVTHAIMSLSSRGLIYSKGEVHISKRGRATKLWATDANTAFAAQRRIMERHSVNDLENVTEELSTSFEHSDADSQKFSTSPSDLVQHTALNSPDIVPHTALNSELVHSTALNDPDIVQHTALNSPDIVQHTALYGKVFDKNRPVLNISTDPHLGPLSCEYDEYSPEFSTKNPAPTTIAITNTTSSASKGEYVEMFKTMMHQLRDNGRDTSLIDATFSELSQEERDTFDACSKEAWRISDSNPNHLYYAEAKAVYSVLVASGTIRAADIRASFLSAKDRVERLKKQNDSFSAQKFSLSTCFKQALEKITGRSWNDWVSQRPYDFEADVLLPERPQPSSTPIAQPERRDNAVTSKPIVSEYAESVAPACNDSDSCSPSPAASGYDRDEQTPNAPAHNAADSKPKGKLELMPFSDFGITKWMLMGNAVKPEDHMRKVLCDAKGMVYSLSDREILTAAIERGEAYCCDMSGANVLPLTVALATDRFSVSFREIG